MTGTTTVLRIVVVGVTGSGKTTLAQNLGRRCGLAVIDLDDLHWLPGWQKRDSTEFYRLTDGATEAPRWVCSGNYSEVQAAIWPKVQLIVWLDYPFLTVFRQLLRRTWARVRDQKKICNGNTETLRQTLSKDSIIIWLFRSYRRRRQKYGAVFADRGLYPQATYIRLRSPAETAAWLETMPMMPTMTPLQENA